MSAARLADRWRAGRLLGCHLIAPLSGSPPLRCTMQRLCTTPSGTQYDLYAPPNPLPRTLLLLYGLTAAGEKESRLVHFAHALCASGFRLLVPVLPGIKTYRFDEHDLVCLLDLIAAARQEYPGSLGIVAFSYGAALALVAAAQPSVSHWVDVLLLFGPPYRLLDLYSSLSAQVGKEPADRHEAAWDHFVWCQAVLAYRQQDALRLPEDDRHALSRLLWDYCEGITAQQKRQFYRQVLRPRQLALGELEADECQALENLSPQGKLAGVQGRVLILHDPFDPLVTSQQAEQILAELSARGQPQAQRLLITPLISHIAPRFAWRVGDAWHILGMMGELWRYDAV